LPGTPRFAALLLTLAAALSACAGPSQPSPAGAGVVVGLYDSKSGLHLDLANASHPDYADVYSRERADAALKVAPDELMQQLVRDLTERLGFDGLSTEGSPPKSGASLRGWVVIDRGGKRRTFSVPATGATAEQLQAFVAMKLVISEYYTHLGGLQFVNNPQGADIFRGKQP